VARADDTINIYDLVTQRTYSLSPLTSDCTLCVLTGPGLFALRVAHRVESHLLEA
jgi:hypothetical protein